MTQSGTSPHPIQGSRAASLFRIERTAVNKRVLLTQTPWSVTTKEVYFLPRDAGSSLPLGQVGQSLWGLPGFSGGVGRTGFCFDSGEDAGPVCSMWLWGVILSHLVLVPQLWKGRGVSSHWVVGMKSHCETSKYSWGSLVCFLVWWGGEDRGQWLPHFPLLNGKARWSFGGDDVGIF